jgi:hypothetical protein
VARNLCIPGRVATCILRQMRKVGNEQQVTSDHRIEWFFLAEKVPNRTDPLVRRAIISHHNTGDVT